MCIEVSINGGKPVGTVRELVDAIHALGGNLVLVIPDHPWQTRGDIDPNLCLCQIRIEDTLRVNGGADIKTDFLVISCRIGNPDAMDRTVDTRFARIFSRRWTAPKPLAVAQTSGVIL